MISKLTQRIFLKSFVLFLCCSIYVQAQQNSIVFTSPRAGDIWLSGETYTITWTATSEAPATMMLYRVQGTGTEGDTILIGNNISTSTGSHHYTVPEDVDATQQYFFQAMHPANDTAILGLSEIFSFGSSTNINEAALQKNNLKLRSYPNPFSSFTTISYTLPNAGETSVQLLDLNGRIVQQVYTGMQAVGTHQLQLNAAHLTAGVYLLRLKTSEAPVQLKLVVQ